MSFSPDIRATRNFQRQFGKEKRRLTLAEVPKSDIDTLQEHVIDMRSHIHFTDVSDNQENVHDIQDGPHAFYREPDFSTVRIRTLFRDVYGDIAGGATGGVNYYAPQTLNLTNYNSLRLYDRCEIGGDLWYSIIAEDPSPEVITNNLWKWNIGFHPPSLLHGNSLSLNVGTDNRQMFHITNTSGQFPINVGNGFSLGFWIYPTELNDSSTNKNQILAYRYIGVDAVWQIAIRDDDHKVCAIHRYDDGGGVEEEKTDNPTVLSANNWYFICMVWDKIGDTLTLKVNDSSDTTGTLTTTAGTSSEGLFFGSYASASTLEDFQGYLTGVTYYDNTALSGTEMTRLYNYNTVSDTTKPFVVGYGQLG